MFNKIITYVTLTALIHSQFVPLLQACEFSDAHQHRYRQVVVPGDDNCALTSLGLERAAAMDKVIETMESTPVDHRLRQVLLEDMREYISEEENKAGQPIVPSWMGEFVGQVYHAKLQRHQHALLSGMTEDQITIEKEINGFLSSDYILEQFITTVYKNKKTWLSFKMIEALALSYQIHVHLYRINETSSLSSLNTYNYGDPQTQAIHRLLYTNGNNQPYYVEDEYLNHFNRLDPVIPYDRSGIFGKVPQEKENKGIYFYSHTAFEADDQWNGKTLITQLGLRQGVSLAQLTELIKATPKLQRYIIEQDIEFIGYVLRRNSVYQDLCKKRNAASLGQEDLIQEEIDQYLKSDDYKTWKETQIESYLENYPGTAKDLIEHIVKAHICSEHKNVIFYHVNQDQDLSVKNHYVQDKNSPLVAHFIVDESGPQVSYTKLLPTISSIQLDLNEILIPIHGAKAQEIPIYHPLNPRASIGVLKISGQKQVSLQSEGNFHFHVIRLPDALTNLKTFDIHVPEGSVTIEPLVTCSHGFKAVVNESIRLPGGVKVLDPHGASVFSGKHLLLGGSSEAHTAYLAISDTFHLIKAGTLNAQHIMSSGEFLDEKFHLTTPISHFINDGVIHVLSSQLKVDKLTNTNSLTIQENDWQVEKISNKGSMDLALLQYVGRRLVNHPSGHIQIQRTQWHGEETRNKGVIKIQDNFIPQGKKWINKEGGTLEVNASFMGEFSDYRDDGATSVMGVLSISAHKGRLGGKVKTRYGLFSFEGELIVSDKAAFDIEHYLSLESLKGDTNLGGQIYVHYHEDWEPLKFRGELKRYVKKLKPGVYVTAKKNIYAKDAKVTSKNTSIFYRCGGKLHAAGGHSQSGIFKENNQILDGRFITLQNHIGTSNYLGVQTQQIALEGCRNIGKVFAIQADEVIQHKDDRMNVGTMTGTMENCQLAGQTKLHKGMNLKVQDTFIRTIDSLIQGTPGAERASVVVETKDGILDGKTRDINFEQVNASEKLTIHQSFSTNAAAQAFEGKNKLFIDGAFQGQDQLLFTGHKVHVSPSATFANDNDTFFKAGEILHFKGQSSAKNHWMITPKGLFYFQGGNIKSTNKSYVDAKKSLLYKDLEGSARTISWGALIQGSLQYVTERFLRFLGVSEDIAAFLSGGARAGMASIVTPSERGNITGKKVIINSDDYIFGDATISGGYVNRNTLANLDFGQTKASEAIVINAFLDGSLLARFQTPFYKSKALVNLAVRSWFISNLPAAADLSGTIFQLNTWKSLGRSLAINCLPPKIRAVYMGVMAFKSSILLAQRAEAYYHYWTQLPAEQKNELGRASRWIVPLSDAGDMVVEAYQNYMGIKGLYHQIQAIPGKEAMEKWGEQQGQEIKTHYDTLKEMTWNMAQEQSMAMLMTMYNQSKNYVTSETFRKALELTLIQKVSGDCHVRAGAHLDLGLYIQPHRTKFVGLNAEYSKKGILTDYAYVGTGLDHSTHRGYTASISSLGDYSLSGEKTMVDDYLVQCGGQLDLEEELDIHSRDAQLMADNNVNFSGKVKTSKEALLLSKKGSVNTSLDSKAAGENVTIIGQKNVTHQGEITPTGQSVLVAKEGNVTQGGTINNSDGNTYLEASQGHVITTKDSTTSGKSVSARGHAGAENHGTVNTTEQTLFHSGKGDVLQDGTINNEGNTFLEATEGELTLTKDSTTSGKYVDFKGGKKINDAGTINGETTKMSTPMLNLIKGYKTNGYNLVLNTPQIQIDNQEPQPSLNSEDFMEQKGDYSGLNISQHLELNTQMATPFTHGATSKSQNFILNGTHISVNSGVTLNAPAILQLGSSDDNLHLASNVNLGAGVLVKLVTPHSVLAEGHRDGKVTINGGTGILYEYTDPKTGEKSQRLMGVMIEAGNKISGTVMSIISPADIFLHAIQGIENKGIVYYNTIWHFRSKKDWSETIPNFVGGSYETGGKVIFQTEGDVLQEGIDCAAVGGVDIAAKNIYLNPLTGTYVKQKFDAWTGKKTGKPKKDDREKTSGIQNYGQGNVNLIAQENANAPGLFVYNPEGNTYLAGRNVELTRLILNHQRHSSGWKGLFSFQGIPNPFSLNTLQTVKDLFHALNEDNLWRGPLDAIAPSMTLGFHHVKSTSRFQTLGAGGIISNNLEINAQNLSMTNGYGGQVRNDLSITADRFDQSCATLNSETKTKTKGFSLSLGSHSSFGYQNQTTTTKTTTHSESHINAGGTANLNIGTYNQDGASISAQKYDGHVGTLNTTTKQNTSSTKTKGTNVSIGGGINLTTMTITPSASLGAHASTEKTRNRDNPLVSENKALERDKDTPEEVKALYHQKKTLGSGLFAQENGSLVIDNAVSKGAKIQGAQVNNLENKSLKSEYTGRGVGAGVNVNLLSVLGDQEAPAGTVEASVKNRGWEFSGRFNLPTLNKQTGPSQDLKATSGENHPQAFTPNVNEMPMDPLSSESQGEVNIQPLSLEQNQFTISQPLFTHVIGQIGVTTPKGHTFEAPLGLPNPEAFKEFGYDIKGVAQKTGQALKNIAGKLSDRATSPLQKRETTLFNPIGDLPISEMENMGANEAWDGAQQENVDETSFEEGGQEITPDMFREPLIIDREAESVPITTTNDEEQPEPLRYLPEVHEEAVSIGVNRNSKEFGDEPDELSRKSMVENNPIPVLDETLKLVETYGGSKVQRLVQEGLEVLAKSQGNLALEILETPIEYCWITGGQKYTASLKFRLAGTNICFETKEQFKILVGIVQGLKVNPSTYVNGATKLFSATDASGKPLMIYFLNRGNVGVGAVGRFIPEDLVTLIGGLNKNTPAAVPLVHENLHAGIFLLNTADKNRVFINELFKIIPGKPNALWACVCEDLTQLLQGKVTFTFNDCGVFAKAMNYLELALEGNFTREQILRMIRDGSLIKKAPDAVHLFLSEVPTCFGDVDHLVAGAVQKGASKTHQYIQKVVLDELEKRALITAAKPTAARPNSVGKQIGGYIVGLAIDTSIRTWLHIKNGEEPSRAMAIASKEAITRGGATTVVLGVVGAIAGWPIALVVSGVSIGLALLPKYTKEDFDLVKKQLEVAMTTNDVKGMQQAAHKLKAMSIVRGGQVIFNDSFDVLGDVSEKGFNKLFPSYVDKTTDHVTRPIVEAITPLILEMRENLSDPSVREQMLRDSYHLGGF